MHKPLLIFLLSLIFVSCSKYGVTDVSENPERVEGFKVGSRYVSEKDMFLYGLIYGEPLSYYENETANSVWCLLLTLPIGPEKGAVPDSFEEWEKEKNNEFYSGIYGVIPSGTRLEVEIIHEIQSLKDHTTQVLARIQDGEFKGYLVSLSWISEMSRDKLKISRDNNNLKEVEQ